ncbi:uncharacterized protein BO97DRAFT_427708 [Aspergillus homomorphus CBS 101889]|uniref:Uncharacterized protein n=1 Tax=Aspergillus homomorphus (strain CBS 101889) TaxID=1450537 RepID=A0A395HMR9_ASPHC|nr:hypothetical protein BO97DRAFT_427708 [Aspergillus homomorphus CBS 101889]RAL09231.1 hypothetical protein BO97DRAFT_427708 [Aspergillus homomorphus CBS 101889]
MFRSAVQSLYLLHTTRSARYFHRVTTNFINYDAQGDLLARKVPIIIGDPGQTYVLIDPTIGSALRAASPLTPASSAARAEDRCKLTFFHDLQYFGFDPSPDSIRHKPCNFVPEWKKHELVLDGTPDAKFAELARASARTLESSLDQLKDM